MNANRIAAILCCGLLTQLQAQQTLESTNRTAGSAVTAAFESQRAVLQTSSALIMDGRSERAYGVVISADGMILTKASEILGINELSVTVDQTKYKDVKVLAADSIWDVALLKIDASGLIPVVYAPTSDLAAGTWVIANGASSRTNRRLLAGVISARIHEVPVTGGVLLGVILVNGKATKLEIASVSKKSGAREAGLKKGDVILTIDGKKVTQLKEIAEILKDRKPETTVSVTWLHGKEEKAADVRLMARSEVLGPEISRNDMMSGDFSKRRDNFPRVMEHDILANSMFIGGPLLDLDGRCVGMNIARANRAETFAIPVEDLKALAEHLPKQAAETKN